ncbi:MAG: adenylate/guanylate cyclase domain-containing protein [Gemmobacter sp.]|uniref:adenylate/guanylate cyclase domain-containing protein n=1 Tax=Gemmobacter sp. TaxID=1898957 RepID=UPI001A577AA7|nr:adenylate/guanylate cyclase domain-containing protein [Gemmobacter sp.]MBL8562730.1 adenylate/guanylate cyclase domain-containing protein [Gemmobacter sp.]
MLWRAATLGLTLGLAGGLAAAPDALRAVQERLFDRLIQPAKGEVRVIDIGAVDETGAPWSRAATARLVERLAASRPALIGFDMLFAGDCDGQAAQDLARALDKVPAVLGVLLSPSAGPDLPPSRLALAGQVPLWPAAGADAPCPGFARQEWAAMALMGDADATVRRVPVGVSVQGQALPSLALAMAARLQGEAMAGPDWLRLGAAPPLPTEAGTLRFAPSAPATWASRTLQAEAVLTGQALVPVGAVLLVGSSLPQRGGLRPTAASPVTPSVQIWADALNGLHAGHLPHRPGFAAWLEAGFVALAGLAALLALARTTPARAALLLGFGAVAWAGAAMAASRAGWLIDPALPPAALALIALTAITGRAASLARAERVLRDRMGQVLPPALVARIAAQPRLMRLEGEAREVTALFTDIEGFSTATAEMGAAEMVARLDAYFARVAAIVLRHGGMIDKLVGDSLHALFNAPLDQPGHEAAALACAAEIIAATEDFRRKNNGFGRTRIGVETGPAVLGDVGFGTRIDYTAHGPAVNLAARLQEANKQFGTQVCIGPGLAARVPGLRPLGEAELRSFGRLPLFTLRA